MQRARRLLARRYREDVRTNWNLVSIQLWLVYIALFTHWSGLMWAWVGTRNRPEPVTGSWLYAYTSSRTVTLDGQPLTAAKLAEDIPTLYLRSVYWATITMTTVGYGDISGQNPTERLVNILVMLIGVIAFSFMTGALSSILQNVD